jgi:phosphohistidine phosphatase SixA
MKMNQNIDESLNSFIDGELTESRQSEVQRLIADDPQVAQRLRELRACKALVSSLPRAEAPAAILQQVKASLQARTPQSQQPSYSTSREATRFVLVRRVVAAAAVVGLIAVLAAVMQTLIPSNIAPDRFGPEIKVAEAGFTGRLELKTAALVAVDASINKAINNNGLSDCVSSTQVDGRKVYSLRCTKEGLNLLLADLDNVWQRFDSAILFVDTEHFGKPIVVDAVTAKQTAEIINQENLAASAKLAEDIAVLNNLAESMPGKDILAAVGDSAPSLITVPKPFLAWNKETAKDSPSPAQDSEKVSLMIVVSGAE